MRRSRGSRGSRGLFRLASSHSQWQPPQFDIHMRAGKGCARCRNRHIRCVIPSGASSCTPCSRLGRNCQFNPRFQFKSVNHIYQKGNGTSARYDLVWDEDQVWVDLSQPVRFMLEATDGSVGDDTITRPNVQTSFLTPQPNCSVGESDETPPHHLGRHRTESPNQGFLEDRSQVTTKNSFPPFLEVDTVLSFREASLIRNFIQRIAPWADICDVHFHFSTDVPRRSLENPMVLKAVLALSARHDAILSNDSDWEAAAYHGECLEMLLAALDREEAHCDENLLITVVILRIYEELENNTDQRFHLLGSTRLVNLVSHSASSGGVAEAVSWQFLRQAIFSSVVQYQPLQLELRNFEFSTMFHRNDDAACANRMIYYCARILQLCCDQPGQIVGREAWCDISDRVEEWNETKPATWQPIRYQAANLAADRPFPELWMISPPTVVGMQYYHSACIFLTLSDIPSGCISSHAIACSVRTKEKTIAKHLIMVIGLSLSNESVQNAYFMACHLLHRFGYCLRNLLEQQGSLRFLARAEKRLGWRTSWIMQELEHQWAELAALDSWDPLS